MKRHARRDRVVAWRGAGWCPGEAGRNVRVPGFLGWRNRVGCLLILVCAALAGCGPRPAGVLTQKPKPEVSFKPQEMTDALHAVIASDRAAYARLVLQRLHDSRTLESSENWRDSAMLPLHADLLKTASQAVQQPGAEFHYALRSLQPIAARNAPQTETEQAGLRAVLLDPGKPFYREEFLGGRRYFTAVYADRAQVKLCIDCHNAHPKSPRRDYQEGEVMGGIVVRVPLEF